MREDRIKKELRRYMEESRKKEEKSHSEAEKRLWEEWVFGALCFAYDAKLISFNDYKELMDEYEGKDDGV